MGRAVYANMAFEVDQSRSTPLPPASALAALVGRDAAVGGHLQVMRQHGALHVATICSGTEAPIIALQLLGVPVRHLFSCEIEPVKQAYIYRNFAPEVLFRDVRDLGGAQAPDAWGVMREVPRSNVDVLVAGTSCVDFSKLNPRKKGLEEGGESGKTFEGMLNWVSVALPRIVLLENVCGAPWEIMCAAFVRLGYTMETTQVDSKHYLLPQTRVRGYAIGFRVPKVQEWSPVLRRMAWPGGQPSLSSYILPGLAPEVIMAKATLTRVRRRAAPCYEWTRCERRHKMARLDEGLGEGRPCTGWAEGGAAVVRDGSWGEFATYLGSRKSDLLDVNYLRHATRGRDPLHRTCVWNLQQNVNWETGHTKQEVCPCLTPGMLPWVTDQGRPLIGMECLHLQGIPTETLSLASESNPELMHLAGNAMTVTVVGCALAAGLFCGDILGSGARLAATAPCWRQPGSAPSNSIPNQEEVRKDLLCKLVAATSPRCLCADAAGDPLQCDICYHTACMKCGTNPLHSYSPVQASLLGSVPADGAGKLARMFPSSIRLSRGTASYIYHQCSNVAGIASWHVAWDTNPPTKELRCTVWTLPSPRVVWEIGVERMEVVGDGDIMKGEWTTLAVSPYERVGVAAAAPQANIVEGWLHGLGARGGGTRPTIVEFKSIGALSGVYHLAQQCDSPCNSLYARADGASWFVFDPRIARYVFTQSIGFRAALRAGFCDPCIETDLTMEAFAALTQLPLTFAFSPVRHKCTGPRLAAAQFEVGTAPPPVFTSRSECGEYSRVPSRRVDREWCEWLPLPAHEGDGCDTCAPKGATAGTTMVAAWHARPPPIVPVDGVTVGVDPIALQHRARRTHPVGDCHYRMAPKGPLPSDDQHRTPSVIVTSATGALSAAQPGGMHGSSYELRHDQRLAVAWAQKRESSPVEFLDEFVLETRALTGVSLQLRSVQPVAVRGGVLADGVGYGKTIVALSLVEPGAPQPTLVLAPGHLLKQWATEASRLFPGLHTIVIASAREGDIWKNRPCSTDVLITTVGQLARLGVGRWARLIVDEYTFMDKAAAKQVAALGPMPRWLLSATPPLETRSGIIDTARLLGHSFGFEQCALLAPWAGTCDPPGRTSISERFAKLVAPSGRDANAAANKTIARFCDVLIRRGEPQTGLVRHRHEVISYHVPHAERVLNTLATHATCTMNIVERTAVLVCHGFSTDRLLTHFSEVQRRVFADESTMCRLTSQLRAQCATAEITEWFTTLRHTRAAPDALAARRILHALATGHVAAGVTVTPQTAFFELLGLQKKHAAGVRTLRYISGCCTSVAHPCDACGLVTKDLTFSNPCLHLLCGSCNKLTVCPHTFCGTRLCNSRPPPPRHHLGATTLSRSWGSTIQCLLDIIEQKLPQDEGCVVFYQGVALGDTLEGAMTTAGLQVRVLRGSDKRQSRIMHDIQTRRTNGQRIVLLLHLGTAEASGSNLTGFCYNIFVHTPHAVGNQRAADVKTQAIGRTLRFGQSRPVTTYELRPDYDLI